MLRRLGFLVVAASFAACGDASISGTVGGESVRGARSAVFDTFEVTVPVLGTFGAAIVVVTDIPNACDTLTDLLAAGGGTCEATCGALSARVSDQLSKDDYFLTTMTLNTGGNPEREYKYASTPGTAGDFNASIVKIDVSALYDVNECVAACQSNGDIAPQRAFVASGGEVEVKKYTAGESLKGTFEFDFSGNDDLKGSFSAEPCALRSVFGF